MKEGDQVKAGDTLAILEAPDVKAQDVYKRQQLFKPKTKQFFPTVVFKPNTAGLIILNDLQHEQK